MNKISLIFALVLIVCALPARAEPVPAFVNFEGACGFADSDFNFDFSNDVKRISTSDRAGNAIVKCFASGVFNDTGTVVKWNFENTGFPCMTLRGPTLDWQQVLTPSGKVSLVCRYKSDS